VIRQAVIGQYIPGDSLLHRLDPRTKLTFLTFYVVILFFATGAGYALLGGVAIFGVAASRISPRYILRGLRPLVFLLALTMAFQIFMVPGDVIWRFGFLQVTRQGLVLGLFMALRLLLLVVTTSLLTLTTSPIALTDGLESMLRPLTVVGVPAHEFAMMMTIALRFIPTLMDEADKVMKAQMARGAEFSSGSLTARARSLVPVLVPLFVGAFRRADDLAIAMEARCYRGGEGRTRMRQLRLGGLDLVALTAAAGMVAGILLLR
jgi:energy-coupling factor transport system permease protein